MGELIDGQPLFPGENEIDMLYLIQKLLGPLTSEQKEFLLKNPRFLGKKFPDLSKPETIERRYLGKLNKRALAFMKALLKLDPKERLTCNEALKHPYFDDMAEGVANEEIGKKEGEVEKVIIRTKTREKRADLEYFLIFQGNLRFLFEKSKEKKQERMEKAVVVQEEHGKQIHEVFYNFIIWFFRFYKFSLL